MGAWLSISDVSRWVIGAVVASRVSISHRKSRLMGLGPVIVFAVTVDGDRAAVVDCGIR